ncbi:MAG: hypothetical protein LBI06_06675 [Treponema sp.]|jgi:hypothetical protein|nr:hypothetical protein [Treponema sp.]
MGQAQFSRKTSVAGIIVASICILVYLGALVSVIVRINTNMEDQRLVAEQEFFDLADLASSAGVLSFMDESYIEIIQKALDSSQTLEGVIISGPSGEYGFEKERGRALNWVNGSPRFRSRFDFSRQALYLPLRIQGLRNVNIQAVAGALDYAELAVILKQALVIIASALLLAFITLILESLRRGGNRASAQAGGKNADGKTFAKQAAESKPSYAAGGSYSQRGRVVREENTEARLTEELQNCAAAGQDLSFIVIEYKPAADETFYARFTADAARFFSSRDFVCERGEKGISVICPGFSLDAGFLNADEFHNRIMGKYPAFFSAITDICMGISSRSERPVNAERLMFEAEEALERAMMDPVSHIVAFKSDPEKYRAFMESKQG